jgi:acyl carrier protein
MRVEAKEPRIPGQAKVKDTGINARHRHSQIRLRIGLWNQEVGQNGRKLPALQGGERLKKTLANQAAVLLADEARFEEDLCSDSLALVEIAMAIEDHFNLSIPDERWDQVKTVGDLYEMLAELLQERRR